MSFNKIITFVIALLLLSCGDSEKDQDCVAASEAATQYYRCLVEGNSSEFVNGFKKVATFPDEYIDNLNRNAEHFMKVQKERHGGISSVNANSAVKDSVNNTVNVFLSVSYGDSTENKIVVPMVKHNDKWLMK